MKQALTDHFQPLCHSDIDIETEQAVPRQVVDTAVVIDWMADGTIYTRVDIDFGCFDLVVLANYSNGI